MARLSHLYVARSIYYCVIIVCEFGVQLERSSLRLSLIVLDQRPGLSAALPSSCLQLLGRPLIDIAAFEKLLRTLEEVKH